MALASVQYGVADKPRDAPGRALYRLRSLRRRMSGRHTGHLLNRRLLENIRADFGIQAGASPKDGAVLNTFRPEDRENFIR